jgi:hypothetical protein
MPTRPSNARSAHECMHCDTAHKASACRALLSFSRLAAPDDAPSTTTRTATTPPPQRPDVTSAAQFAHAHAYTHACTSKGLPGRLKSSALRLLPHTATQRTSHTQMLDGPSYGTSMRPERTSSLRPTTARQWLPSCPQRQHRTTHHATVRPCQHKCPVPTGPTTHAARTNACTATLPTRPLLVGPCSPFQGWPLPTTRLRRRRARLRRHRRNDTTGRRQHSSHMHTHTCMHTPLRGPLAALTALP